ncbi:MAG: 3-isopropylmalate dehydratase small subunit [Candidatus Dormibacteria bacterium]
MRETGVMAPLPVQDIDTDQLVPKQFLKSVSRTGYANALFFDWRKAARATPGQEFVLDRAPFDRAVFLLTGANFGCGSSREHAVWALQEFGIRAVVAPSFADIFAANALACGLVLVTVTGADARELARVCLARPGEPVTIDLPAGEISHGDGTVRFEMDGSARHRLMSGLDQVGLTLALEASIRAHEEQRPPWMPAPGAV